MIEIINKINSIYPLLAPVVFVLVFLFDTKKLEVKLEAVAKFVAFLVIFGAIKLCFWEGTKITTNPHNLPMKLFLTVFLEDVFYVMIPFYLTQKIQNKYIIFLIWTVFSILFGFGHIYQGVLAVFITGMYPYFISNHFAKKTSFGTVMVCHFLWDCFTVLLGKLSNLFYFIDLIK